MNLKYPEINFYFIYILLFFSTSRVKDHPFAVRVVVTEDGSVLILLGTRAHHSYARLEFI